MTALITDSNNNRCQYGYLDPSNLLFVNSVLWYLLFPISESGFHVHQQVSRNDAVFSTKFIDDNSPQSHPKTLVLTQIGEFLAINGRIELSV